MVPESVEKKLINLQKYVTIIVNSGVIRFKGNVENGFVEYVTDFSGNTFARIVITLIENKIRMATCSLQFQPFNRASMFRCICNKGIGNEYE